MEKNETNKQFICTLLLVLVIHLLIPHMTQMKLLVIGKGEKGWMEMK